MLSRPHPIRQISYGDPGLEVDTDHHSRLEAGVDLVFEASCRPLSWSLYGVHVRDAAAAVTCPAYPVGHRSQQGAPARGWDEIRITHAIRTVSRLRTELGSARLWLWCPDGLPCPRTITILAGRAALSGVKLESLGLELSATALWRFGGLERERVIELRSAGLDVAVRVGWCSAQPQGARQGSLSDAASHPESPLGGAPSRADRYASEPLEASVGLAHAMRMTVVAGAVTDRQRAKELGNLGISAIAGPAVSPTLDLESLRRFLGPREAWLDRIRADAA